MRDIFGNPIRRDIILGGTSKPTGGGRKPISKPLRDQVWLKYIGNKTQGNCESCRRVKCQVLDWDGLKSQAE